MTLREAIDMITRLKPSAFEESDIIRWISELDNIVKKEIFDSHEGEPVEFTGYTGSTDKAITLLIPDEFCECYLYYVSAKIDLVNGEFARYNNSLSAFDSLYDAFTADYIRTHMPKSATVVF